MVFVDCKPIRSYLYERKTLQKSKYKKRETVNVFECLTCKSEIHLRNSDIRKATGLCRKCCNKKSAKQRGYECRKKPYEALFNSFKARTKRDKKENHLSFIEFLEFVKHQRCHYCFDFIYWTEYNLSKNGANYNLDRKNNCIGYTKDNCVVCCWKCNESKKDNYSYEEWFIMTEYFRNKICGL